MAENQKNLNTGSLPMIEYKGKKYTASELARELNVTRQMLNRRIKDYGLDEAIRLCRLPKAEQERWRKERTKNNQDRNKTVINYKGQDITLIELCARFNTKTSTFRNWVMRHGEHNAILLMEAKEKDRPALFAQLNAALKAERLKDPQELPNDPDYELKNRIISWRQQGWSDDEIRIKARMV